MPFYDGTGPFGRGPLTGRGYGYCDGLNFRGGRGFGRFGGMPFFHSRPLSKEEQKELLSSYKEELEQELSFVQEELKKF